MSDRLTDAHARIEEATSALAIRARDDLSATAYPSAPGGPTVTSSSTADPTGLSVTADQAGNLRTRLGQAGDYQQACYALEKAASVLEKTLEGMTPRITGEQCPTVARDPATGEHVRCTGQVTHRGRCEQCDGDWRIRRGLPLPVDVIEARNRRRLTQRWCACPATCCARDADDHTSCTDRAEEGRTVSRRCRGRMERARADRAS